MSRDGAVVRLTDRIARASAPLRGGGRGRALVVIAVGWLLILGTRITLPVLLPGIKETFAIGNATAGFAITVVWGVYALAQFPAGLLGDRIGDRRVLIASLGLMTVSVIALGAAPVFAAFLAGAALIGIGNGLFGPTRGTLLSSIYPDNDSTAIGLVLAVGSIGAAALPVLAGLVVGRLGWRLTIAGAAPLFLVTAVLAWRFVPQPDGGGAAGNGWESLRRLAPAILDRPVLLGVGGKSLRVFVFQGLSAFLPTYLIALKGLDEGMAGALLSLLFVSGAAAQGVSGRASARFGERPVLVALLLASAVPLLALPFASGLGAITALVFAVGIQYGATPITNAYVIDALPPTDRSGAWGFLRTTYFLIGSTGSAFVGVLADAGLFDGAFLVLGGLLVVVAGVFAALPPRRSFG